MKRQRSPFARPFKQPGSSNWWIQYSVNGKRRRESSGSPDHAVAMRLLKKRIADAASGKPVGPAIERTSFGDMATMIKNEYSANGRRSLGRLGHALAHLSEFFGDYRALSITTDRVVAYVAHRQEQGAANATVNRELAALKRAFRLAEQAGKVARRPHIAMLAESNARQGFVEHGDFVALREALSERLRDPITFLYLSGWRVSEMKSLEWRDVDLPGRAVRLRPEQSKNAVGRLLPLSGELAEVLARSSAARRLDCPLVFHDRGKPILDFRGAWAAACTKAGLGKLLVHDLRRTAIRDMVRAGVPERVAMSLSGHKTRSVFDRYNIVSEADLTAAIERRDSYLADRPTARKVVPLAGAHADGK